MKNASEIWIPLSLPFRLLKTFRSEPLSTYGSVLLLPFPSSSGRSVQRNTVHNSVNRRDSNDVETAEKKRTDPTVVTNGGFIEPTLQAGVIEKKRENRPSPGSGSSAASSDGGRSLNTVERDTVSACNGTPPPHNGLLSQEEHFVNWLNESENHAVSELKKQYRQKIAAMEKQFLQQNQQLIRSKEADIWERDERHYMERHQLAKRQLKDIFFLQRHQMLLRFEKEPEQIKRQNEANEWELTKQLAGEKKLMPKRIWNEMKSRELMCRESLRINAISLEQERERDRKLNLIVSLVGAEVTGDFHISLDEASVDGDSDIASSSLTRSSRS